MSFKTDRVQGGQEGLLTLLTPTPQEDRVSQVLVLVYAHSLKKESRADAFLRTVWVPGVVHKGCWVPSALRGPC